MQLNSRGSSLIQVLLVAGVVSILSLVMTSMVSAMWKDSAREQAKNREVVLGIAILERLSAPELCMTSLLNKNGFTAPVATRELQMKVDGSADIVKDGATLPNWDLKIESLYLKNVVKVRDLPITTESLYEADVILQASAANSSQASFKEKDLGTLYVTTAIGDTTVTNCFLKSGSTGIALDTCAEANGTWTGAGGCNMKSAVQDGICSAMGGTKNPDGTCETGESTKAQQTIAGAGSCALNQFVSGFTSSGTVNCVAFPTPVPVATPLPPTIRTCTYSYNKCGMTFGKDPGTCCNTGEVSSCSTTGSKMSFCGQHNDTMGSITSHFCVCTTYH